ncbi:hypothetical protein KUTeg_001686 [Tegillarca granosa]|uniref:Solute carrier family 25 member 36 n=1 Tax=Tegillarca granosa TaxID=220873 RepID=A0ABQ9FS59_TEGGR|nr:hypothetical protein KUTeg_001686 [Tegillarca granosa]
MVEKSYMASNEFYGVHLLAGGIGGTVGAILTCPLEVVKTRLQSSTAKFHPTFEVQASTLTPYIHTTQPVSNFSIYTNVGTTEAALQHAKRRSPELLLCLRQIIQTEGVQALFKGLGPNLVGVAPSRCYVNTVTLLYKCKLLVLNTDIDQNAKAIYFFSYANMKKYLNSRTTPDTALVHICSAVSAGIASSTATNPIWFIKTRLQLDQKVYDETSDNSKMRDNSLTCSKCIKQVYKSNGILGFYKASQLLISELQKLFIHFVIYEAVKARLLAYNNDHTYYKISDFLKFMLAGAISKTCATCIAYPHEVVRTRLREEGSKYKSFFQTLSLVAKEEGVRNLYRGLSTQLIRQIPNTAIMMSTYEAVVYLCTR